VPITIWLPEIMRRRPHRELAVRYRVGSPPVPRLAEALQGAFRAAEVPWRRDGDLRWTVELQWQTMVLGVIRRDVDELVEVSVNGTDAGSELCVRCRPDGVQAAHATGCAGVLVIAVAAWVLGGWKAGLPAALATAAAGGLMADVMREMALRVLARRLRRLAEDLGTAVWPAVVAEVVEETPPASIRAGDR
jgi:hypothetical protein